MQYLLQPLVELVRNYGIKACEYKAREIARTLCPRSLANIGGGKESIRWPAAQNCDNLITPGLDFNTNALPYFQQEIDLVVCEQVIEHLHNTTWFLQELYRILSPTGYLLLSTENLASLPNIFALILQRAPFSTQAVCGQFIGGWKKGKAGKEVNEMSINHPAYSGVKGHVRVLTTGQLKELLKQAGFKILNKYGFGGNHYILFYCKK